MSQLINDVHIVGLRRLISPRELREAITMSDSAAEVVFRTRQAIADIIHGRDRCRVLVVVGPCSMHDPAADLEYAANLKKVADQLQDRLVIVMRTYFEKPRTTVGWKGLINDPHLDGSCDIATGLKLARRTLLQINEMGLPCSSELLEPITPQYIADMVSWACIGARTTESQIHREMASGLSMPLGFKNGTDGTLEVARNAMISARHPHTFLGVSQNGVASIIETAGNPNRHLVLRGGGGRTNYGPDDMEQAIALVRDECIARPIMVDCSHDNSNKNHTLQGGVCKSVTAQIRQGRSEIMGLMLESNLKPGKQTWKEGAKLEYGVSITDGCIGWDETESLLFAIAEAIEEARTLHTFTSVG